jgi:hypothetical protein
MAERTQPRPFAGSQQACAPAMAPKKRIDHTAALNHHPPGLELAGNFSQRSPAQPIVASAAPGQVVIT